MNTVIVFRVGTGRLFNQVEWRCWGDTESCGPWMGASSWEWAERLATEHSHRLHGGQATLRMPARRPA